MSEDITPLIEMDSGKDGAYRLTVAKLKDGTLQFQFAHHNSKKVVTYTVASDLFHAAMRGLFEEENNFGKIQLPENEIFYFEGPGNREDKKDPLIGKVKIWVRGAERQEYGVFDEKDLISLREKLGDPEAA